jgi:hypothetical protein
MPDLQNLTNAPAQTSESEETVKLRAYQQDQYIAFVACGGLIPDPTGEKAAIKMTTQEFANNIQVSRQTLYDWRKTIPEFWEKVNQKRREIGSKDRLANVWNGLYLKAATGNVEAAKLYLANHDDEFRMPMERRENNLGSGLADLVARKLLEQNRETPKVIDVASEPNNNT